MLDALLMAVALSLAEPRAPAPAERATEAKEDVLLREGRPERGLAWRLHLPAAATAGAPARLIVWLHPAGGRSFNAEVEALVPLLSRAGFALLVPVDKDYALWSGDDAMRLLQVTLPDLARVPEVDASRPILFGFSGGGQLALALFHAIPRAFAGLILDAAYPVLEGPEGARPRTDPPGEAARGARVLAVVGTDDPMARVWDAVAPAWRARGIHLTILMVPGRGHEWLLAEPDVRAALATWLAALPPRPSPPAPVSPVPPGPPEPVR